MSRNKTQDGIRLGDILRVAREIGAEIRTGSSHPFVLNYRGLRPCPIASSTHAKRMVAPWIAEATGRSNNEAYEALRNGYWEQN